MAQRNYGLTLNYKAITTGGIPKYRIVKFGANENEVDLATAAADLSIGVSSDIDSALNERCDVIRSGLVPVLYGGTVTRGAFLTSDATGRAIAATAAAGANIRIIGIAEVSGVVGDIGSMVLAPGSFQG
ncbi:capsid cement protein [Leptolyngbyaceae cyanobacterium UHCC 1019]